MRRYYTLAIKTYGRIPGDLIFEKASLTKIVRALRGFEEDFGDDFRYAGKKIGADYIRDNLRYDNEAIIRNRNGSELVVTRFVPVVPEWDDDYIQSTKIERKQK